MSHKRWNISSNVEFLSCHSLAKFRTCADSKFTLDSLCFFVVEIGPDSTRPKLHLLYIGSFSSSPLLVSPVKKPTYNRPQLINEFPSLRCHGCRLLNRFLLSEWNSVSLDRFLGCQSWLPRWENFGYNVGSILDLENPPISPTLNWTWSRVSVRSISLFPKVFITKGSFVIVGNFNWSRTLPLIKLFWLPESKITITRIPVVCSLNPTYACAVWSRTESCTLT